MTATPTSSPEIMRLLHDHVPLTLLLDVLDARNLPSRAILRREGADLSWLAPRPASGAAAVR